LSLPIHFINENIGYESFGHRIFKTTDGGINWTKIIGLGNSNIVEIHFIDEMHGWAICFDGTILKYN
jgi:photosystem II stability/assembly factor-like uncharacterized protein